MFEVFSKKIRGQFVEITWHLRFNKYTTPLFLIFQNLNTRFRSVTGLQKNCPCAISLYCFIINLGGCFLSSLHKETKLLTPGSDDSTIFFLENKIAVHDKPRKTIKL